MPISNELLAIICCPTTKQDLTLLSNESVIKLNALQGEKKLKFKDGNTVDYSLSGALITEDQKTLYPIREDIPILLEEESILASIL